MKITNEDYIREIKRYLKYPDFVCYVDVIDKTQFYICYGIGMSIRLDLTHMDRSMRDLYGKTIRYFTTKINHGCKKIDVFKTIVFPSSYEELCIINDLNGN